MKAAGRLRGPAAFTLVELLLTISIMILILGMLFPVFDGFVNSQRLDGTVGVIRSALRKTRALAIHKRQRSYFVVKDQGRFGYGLLMKPVSLDNETLTVDAANAVAPYGYLELYEPDAQRLTEMEYVGVDGATFTLEDVIQIDENQDRIFHPDGEEVFPQGLVELDTDPPNGTLPYLIVFETDGTISEPAGGDATFRVTVNAGLETHPVRFDVRRMTGRVDVTYLQEGG